MAYGPELLSKICDAGDVRAITRYQIAESDFPTPAERQAFRFITDYATENGGQAPSGDLVEAEVPEFAGCYFPNVSEPFEWLTRKFKDDAGKRKIQALFGDQGEANRKFDELPADEYIDYLTNKLSRISIETNVRQSVGTSVKSGIDEFKAEYGKRARGESFRVWHSKFPKINAEVGGFTSGNVYAWYGRSGRGKSIIAACCEAVESAMQGATVLIWSMEMPRYEVLARLYVELSGRAGVNVERIDGIEQACGFNNRDIRMASLTAEQYDKLDEFLAQLADLMPGDIIIRAVDDDDFGSRRVRDLQADIMAVGADVVVIDPIYYMDFEANSSKTKGGDIAATSKALRRLAGSEHIVIHNITQAGEIDEDEDEDGERELKPPTRKELAKSKTILQDAALTLGIDTNYKSKQGVIKLNKGRDGGEGAAVELTFIPSVGIVRELPTGEAAGEYFGF